MLGPSVDHEPLDRVGGALVLQLPHVGRQPRAVPVPLVPEVTEVSGGVPLPEVARPADVQRHLVVAVLVLGGHLRLIDTVFHCARAARHGAVPGAAGARRVRRRATGCCAS